MLIQLAACWKDNSSLISIHLMLMLIVLWMQSISRHGNFNTSHVNVNHRFIASESFGLIHFNTSHVNVNLLLIRWMIILYMNFNTSHVNVNRGLV